MSATRTGRALPTPTKVETTWSILVDNYCEVRVRVVDERIRIDKQISRSVGIDADSAELLADALLAAAALMRSKGTAP